MAKQVEESQNVIMEKGLPGNNERIRMKTSRLKRMPDHVILQVQEIDRRIIEKTVPIPRRGAKIPKVRDYKEHEPEQKERCFRLYPRLQTGSEFIWTWEEG